MNKHPHAELMKQYAEDAMKTSEPWDLWLTRKNGDCNWVRCTNNPVWSESYEYKRRASHVMIGNIEFPEPYVPSARTDSERVFYTIAVYSKGLVAEGIQRHGANFEKFDDLRERGLIFKQLEDCECYIKSLTELNKKIITFYNQ